MSEDRFRVVVLDDYERFCTTVPAYREVAAVADVEVVQHKLDTDAEWAAAVGDAHAVVLMRERSPFREREFALARSLRFISQIGRGVPHLDLAEATRRGIPVSCTPNDSGASTVELTFALLLALARQVPSVSQGMREGAWPPAVGDVAGGEDPGNHRAGPHRRQGRPHRTGHGHERAGHGQDAERREGGGGRGRGGFPSTRCSESRTSSRCTAG